MNPRSETLAFRIWAYCEPREWDCTFREVGHALNVSPFRVQGIVSAKGWGGRLRTTAAGTVHGGDSCWDARLAADEFLDGISSVGAA